MPRRNGVGIALLADPTRRAIIALLAEKPQRPSVLAATLGLSRPAVSRQLRLLHDADLVARHRSLLDGRRTVFTVNPRQMRPILAWLAATSVGFTNPSGSEAPA